jgi:hypothetical protein
MPKLEKIWIATFDGRHELRMDWDNERHQAVAIRTLEPEDVKQGLLEAAHLIAKEQAGGQL